MNTPAVFLDWTKTGSAGRPAPCLYCRRPAICRAPTGEPCHKTCAEAHSATPRPATPVAVLGSAT